VEEAGEMRLRPEHVDIGDPPHHEDEVEVTMADHLVGDIEAIAPGVPGLVFHLVVAFVPSRSLCTSTTIVNGRGRGLVATGNESRANAWIFGWLTGLYFA